MSSEGSELAVKKFVARAELSALTRSLRTKLSRAANRSPAQPEQPRRKTHPARQLPQPASRQSLFTSILAPPLSKQARTILNPSEAPRPAPVRPKPVRKSPQKKRKLETDGDVEIKAAEALTSLLQQQRSTPMDDRTSTPRPPAPTDNEAADLMLYLATSPSPVRNKDHRPIPITKGRVLFPQDKPPASTNQPPPKQLLPAPPLPELYSQFINASPQR